MRWDWHNKVSMAKSGFRIVGYALLAYNIILGAALLIIAELGGIAEEM